MRTSLTIDPVASASWVNRGLTFGGGFSFEPPLMIRRPVLVVTVCGLTMINQCYQIGLSTSDAVRHFSDVISTTLAIKPSPEAVLTSS